MLQHATRTLLAAACLFAATGAAQAAAFTWTPDSVGLAGSGFTADSLILGDYAQIRFTDGGAAFTDAGYMPILGASLTGRAVAPQGLNAADGTGWGAYVKYSATGTQTWLAPGVPGSATYTQLDYEIVGYNGLATFSFGADGDPAVGGTQSRVTVLGAGTLIGGGLAFEWTSPGGPTILGDAATTITGVPPRFSDDALAGFDVDFVHPPSDYAFTSAAALQIADGVGHSAGTLLTATGQPLTAPAALAVFEVPEPGTALLVGAGLLGLSLLRRLD